MNKWTEKQQRFIEFRVQGMLQKQSALMAGVSPNSAEQWACRMMARADVKEAIAALKEESGVEEVATDPSTRMKDSYASSLELMRDTYNNPKMPVAMRFEAAKQALPYEHAKLGEIGKKAAKENAAGVASTKGKFAPKHLPTNNVVAMRK